MLAVVFVVAPMAVSFFDRPPPDFLPHLVVHGGSAPEETTRPRRPGKHRIDVVGRRPEVDWALWGLDLGSNRTRFGRRNVRRSLDGVPEGP